MTTPLSAGRTWLERRTRPGRSTPHWDARMALLASTLGASTEADGRRERVVLDLLRDADDARVWLALAVLSGKLPTADQVVDARRDARLDGPRSILLAARRLTTSASARRRVEVVTGATVVDIGDLATSPLRTGIQRVAQNVTREWSTSRTFVPVAWTSDMSALRPLSDDEEAAALHDAELPTTRPGPVTTLVPWRSTYVLPELAVQPARCSALQAMARFSTNRCGVIGFDLVPITSSETSATGFPAVFALNLAAVAHFDVVAAISRAAATEYSGWRRMISGAGLGGPEVVAELLPAHAPEPDEDDLRAARERFVVAGMPFVLCVGSHEPRKNHLAVLDAAESLWRQGHRFSLTFIGGNAWNQKEFSDRVDELVAAGRPVEVASKIPDRVLWAAYRVASFTVFPSLNEGFGLPVAESLAAGTPVVTSRFGSMSEIAEHGGALLVDPTDDDDVATAMGRLLTDHALLARLAGEADGRAASTWASYADRLWDIFTSEEPAPLPAAAYGIDDAPDDAARQGVDGHGQGGPVPAHDAPMAFPVHAAVLPPDGDDSHA